MLQVKMLSNAPKKMVKVKKKDKTKKVLTLHRAVKYDDIDNMRQLLVNGADVNATNTRGETALHVAMEYADIDCVKLLLQEGADVNLRRRDGNTALHIAAALDLDEFIPLLISNGASVDISGYDELTPLHCAVNECHPGCLKILLENGASVNTPMQFGRTALHIALLSSEKCVDLLIEGKADVFAKDVLGITPLDTASELGLQFFRRLLPNKYNVTGSDGTTPLHIASRSINTDCLQYVIGQGCDVNIENDNGDTPLHFACMVGVCYRTIVTPNVQLSHAENVVLLARAGANVRKKNKSGLAPVHVSAMYDRKLPLQALHEFGADLDISGGEKNHTPLHIASQEGNLECVRFLIESGVDKTVVDVDNCTALMLAAKKSHFSCVKLLLEAGVPLWETEKEKK